MIVQRRAGCLRLFRQHDHALVAGELALAWLESGAEPPVSEILVTATALHDLSWRKADRGPRWNPRTGRPFDFLDFPVKKKFRAFVEGVDKVEELDPYAALLVSLHYATFQGAPAWFVDTERERQAGLARRMGSALPDEEAIAADLELLRLFDRLSLHMCLASPEALPEGRPTWLGDQFRVPEWDEPLNVRWWDAGCATLEPWPYEGKAVRVEIPFRDLPAERYGGAEELDRAWREATDDVWGVTFQSA